MCEVYWSPVGASYTRPWAPSSENQRGNNIRYWKKNKFLNVNYVALSPKVSPQVQDEKQLV